jgi:hypothetical protein
MKKIIFGLFSLSLFLSALNAACYVQSVYPGSGPALSAYCWDIAFVASTQQGINNWEDTKYKTSTTLDHGGQEIRTRIDTYGVMNDYTKGEINGKDMVLYATQNIINEYKMLIGTKYFYKRINNTLTTGTIYARNNATKIRMDMLHFK